MIKKFKMFEKLEVEDSHLIDLKDVFQDIIDEGWKVEIEEDDWDELRYIVSIPVKMPGIDKGNRYDSYNVSDDVLLELDRTKNQFIKLANLQELIVEALVRLNNMGFEIRRYRNWWHSTTLEEETLYLSIAYTKK